MSCVAAIMYKCIEHHKYRTKFLLWNALVIFYVATFLPSPLPPRVSTTEGREDKEEEEEKGERVGWGRGIGELEKR